jgi:peptide chain release factor 2
MTEEDAKKHRLTELDTLMQSPDFWADKAKAQALVAEYEVLKQGGGPGAGKYDAGNATLSILSGAGGDDAEDFSRMLLEMYLAWAKKRGVSATLLHENQNDHGGYRNVTVLLEGREVYGILKGESGVHRLVRVSPFNAKKLRHTSFSLVEVVPEFKKTQDLDIPPQDLKVEFARSSGPGGQNVNKRETAVRLTHLPTGLTAHCDAERTQERNRDRALSILRGKLYKRLEDERHKREAGMYVSKTTEIEWGSQIRSYVLHPYKLVKDHRQDIETSDVNGVLAGEIDLFLTPNA